MKIDVWSRDDCPLCDEALEVLRRELARVPHELSVHDLASDPEAEARYREEIPVVLVDGVKRFFGHVNPALLRRLIAARKTKGRA